MYVIQRTDPPPQRYSALHTPYKIAPRFASDTSIGLGQVVVLDSIGQEVARVPFHLSADCPPEGITYQDALDVASSLVRLSENF